MVLFGPSVIILDVTDAWGHYLGEYAMADSRESQEEQSHPHDAAAAVGPAAAALQRVWRG